jgi:hypothetical protein
LVITLRPSPVTQPVPKYITAGRRAGTWLPIATTDGLTRATAARRSAAAAGGSAIVKYTNAHQAAAHPGVLDKRGMFMRFNLLPRSPGRNRYRVVHESQRILGTFD